MQINAFLCPVRSSMEKRPGQAKLFNGKLKMSAKLTTLGRFTPKYPELDQQMLKWFSDHREQGEYSSLHVRSDKHFV